MKKIISAGSKNSASPRFRSSRPSLMLALEPRLLYDGAGADVVAGAAADAVAFPAESPAQEVETVPAESTATATDSTATPEVSGQESEDSTATGTAAANTGATAADPAATPGDAGAATADTATTGADAGGTVVAVPTADTGLTTTDTSVTTETTPVQPAAVNEVVFIDSSVSNSSVLADAAGDSDTTLVVNLDSGSDTLTQISDVLSGYQNLDAIHLVSHGDTGEIQLTGATINRDTLPEYREAVAAWGESLGEEGDILLYGCRVAENGEGETFISELAELTGADVAASDDATGNPSSGGDWTLEEAVGAIEAAEIFTGDNAAAWDGLLAPSVSSEDELTVNEKSPLNATDSDDSTRLSGWEISGARGELTVTVDLVEDNSGTLTGGVTTLTRVFDDPDAQTNASAAGSWINSLVYIAEDVELGNTAGAATVRVTVTDRWDNGGTPEESSFSGTQKITITPVNDPATLDDTSQNVTEGGVTTITGTTLAAVDPEVEKGTQTADQLTYSLTSLPQYGYLSYNGTIIGKGSVFTQADINNGLLKYHHTETAEATQNSADLFTLILNDGATPDSESAEVTVTLNITPVNQEVSVSGAATVYEGQPQNAKDVPAIGLAIKADNGGDPDDALTVVISSLPTDGSLYFDGEKITADNLDTLGTFDYADRAKLSYANNGLRDNDGSGTYPYTDSFDVTVKDSGGGTGVVSEKSTTIAIDVRPVNDDPSFDTPPVDVVDDRYQLQIRPEHLPVDDVDSRTADLTFVVSDQSELNQGKLAIEDNGKWLVLPVGATFTMADVNAGRVKYFQTAQIDSDTVDKSDTFGFQVYDNTTEIRWNEDGSPVIRPGAVYDDHGTDGYGDDTVKTIPFTITLKEHDSGPNSDVEWDLWQGNSGADNSNHAGSGYHTNGDANPIGTLDEGGTITIQGTDHQDNEPFMSYVVTSNDNGQTLDPAQVIYTITSLGEGDDGWNGEIQKDGAALGLYDTFTQKDLDDHRISFTHDGGEDFYSTASFDVSAGVMKEENGTFVQDNWQTTFEFYIKPTNDTPTISGGDSALVQESDISGTAAVENEVILTLSHLSVTDADDADSAPIKHENESGGVTEVSVEADPASPFDPNYAYNNQDGELTVEFTAIPTEGGKLQYNDGDVWQDVAVGTTISAALLKDDATSGLKFVASGDEGISEVEFSCKAVDRHGEESSEEATVKIFITPVNDAPMIAKDPTEPDPEVTTIGGDTVTGVNEPVTVYEGGREQITNSFLQLVDPDNTPARVQYRIEKAPEHGTLSYSTDGATFQNLGVGTSFTQKDIDDGYIYFTHNGDESAGTTYPDGKDDSFTFTISDGDKSQQGNEAWIYVKPVNDPPEVTAPGGPIVIDSDSGNEIKSGTTFFSIDDSDLEVAHPGEQDFFQVVVRLHDGKSTTSPFSSADYSGVTIASAGATPVGHDGDGDYLVLQGTKAELNSALQNLTVSFDDDRDAIYTLEVLVDDRLRDADDGTLKAGANGGDKNQPKDPKDEPGTIPTDEVDYYRDSVTDGLSGNLASASVVLWASSANDPAQITVPTDLTVQEDIATPISGLGVSDSESQVFATPITVTLEVNSGTLDVAAGAGVTIAANGQSQVTLTGTAAAIDALLNSNKVKYTTAANVNHDTNGVADGDVTLTVSVVEGTSNIGDGTGDVVKKVPITITAMNDAPTLTNAETTAVEISSSSPTAITGFTLADSDIGGDGADSAVDGERDQITAFVRLKNSAGDDLESQDYQDLGLVLSSSQSGSVTTDSTFNGDKNGLLLTGTVAEVTAYLKNLQLQVGDGVDTDASYKVVVGVDDRHYSTSGGSIILVEGDPANGGAVNQDGSTPNETFNTAVASRDVFFSTINDPVEITANDVTVSEGAEGETLTLDADNANFVINDPDAVGTNHNSEMVATVTITGAAGVPQIASIGGSGGTVQKVSDTQYTITGTQEQINARLKAINLLLPDESGEPGRDDWNGSFQVTVAVNDQGNVGRNPGAGVNGGSATDNTGAVTGGSDDSGADSALTTTRTITVTVTPENDAPVVDPDQTVALDAVSEESTDPEGKSVSELFPADWRADHYSDGADIIAPENLSDSFTGILITGNAAIADQGRWQYSTGGDWTDLPAVSDSTALYLDKDAQLRFVPTTNFHGTPGALAVHLAEDDGATGVNDSETPLPTSGDTVNGPSFGGATIYSADTVAIGITVTNVNDRPGATPATLETTEGAADNPGKTVAELGFGFNDGADNASAIPGGGNAATDIQGIAIVGNAATADEGTWQYYDGTSWQDIDTGVADDNATVLSADTKIRFQPRDGDYNGEPGGLTVRVSDAPVPAGTGNALSDLDADSSQWSETTTLTASVSKVNDAPELGGTATDPTMNEEEGSNSNIAGVALFKDVTVSDVDLATTSGLTAGTFGAGTVTLALDRTNSGDILKVDSAFTTTATGSYDVDPVNDGTDGRALVLHFRENATTAYVSEVLEALEYSYDGDDPTVSGSDTEVGYTLTLNDGNNLQGGNTAGDGPEDSVALSGTIRFDVHNDPPVNTINDATMEEDTTIPVSDLGLQVADPDAAPDSGDFTVVLSVASGTLQAAAADGVTVVGSGTGSITLTGTMAAINTFLAGNNSPVFDPGQNANGDVEFTMKTTDASYTGSGDTQTVVDTATITVAPRNDAPVLEIPETNGSAGETNRSTFIEGGDPVSLLGTALDTVDVTDADIGTTAGINAFGDGSITISLTDNRQSADRLQLADMAGMDGAATYDPDTGTLVVNLAENATSEQIEAILKAVKFTSADSDPTAGDSAITRGFSVIVNDGNNVQNGNDAGGPAPLSVTKTGTLNVEAVNNPPEATDNSYQTDEDTPVVITPLDGDSDPDGDALTITAINGTAVTGGAQEISVPNGTVKIEADKTITFIPDDNYNGTTAFDYTISDGNGGTDTARVTITVTSVNEVPAAVDDTVTTQEDTPVSGNLATNDTPSPDGGNVWKVATQPEHGSVVVNPDGSYTYTPAANYHGSDSFTYTVTDADGDRSTATVNITVDPVNDLPVATADTFVVNTGASITDSVAGNDTPSGDGGNSWSVATQPANGTVEMNSDGTFTYTPNAGYTGEDSFTYTVTDADGDQSTATVNITVLSKPVVPVDPVDPVVPPRPRDPVVPSPSPEVPTVQPRVPGEVTPAIPVVVEASSLGTEAAAEISPSALTDSSTGPAAGGWEYTTVTDDSPQMIAIDTALDLNTGWDKLLGTDFAQYIHDTVNHSWGRVEQNYGIGTMATESARYGILGGAQDGFSDLRETSREVMGGLSSYLETIFAGEDGGDWVPEDEANSKSFRHQLSGADSLSNESRLLRRMAESLR